MSIQFFYQKILGIFIILTMHVNLDLFSDIRKLFFHHDREFDVKTRGNFIIRYCNRNFIFNSNTVLHLR